MTSEQLQRCLDSLDEAKILLQSWSLRDCDRGQRNLQHLAQALGMEKAGELCRQLAPFLPRCADPDMALNNMERFLAAPEKTAEHLPELLENRTRMLETLVQLFSTSQFFSDLLISFPEYLDTLRIPLRSSPSRAEMLKQLQDDVDGCFEDSAVLRAFRRFRQRQLLRIGTNDIIRDRSLEEVTRDISRVADTAVEVALSTARRNMTQRFGEARGPDGQPARCIVLGFGKLGGKELNYSSDIDLMFVYDQEGSTSGKRGSVISNNEFFARVASEVVRLLSTHTDRGQAYRVDLRLRPEGQRGPLARSLDSTLRYYDTLGRTWERQALIKIRPVAGDVWLGEEFLKAIEVFVYRKYLSFAEINEIKALKRRIEHRTDRAGEGVRDVKTGHGGIRDVEFAIQFLQLLNGGDLLVLRQRNTLKALAALEDAGCLTDQEYRALDDTYRFLRKIEHRLQFMFDLQTHRLPDRADELRRLALRMGYETRDEGGMKDEGGGMREEAGGTKDTKKSRKPHEVQAPSSSSLIPHPSSLDSSLIPHPSSLFSDPLQAFLRDYQEKTTLNRRILEHLLHQTFSDEPATSEPEADLILDPDPSVERIQSILGKYPFKDVQAAYHNLTLLATENVPFLSTRRCRQFLANIAPRLLRTIAESPDPDMALTNLEKVSASLGAKGVLWELFSFNPPTLKLYLELCAFSPFLSEILINNPGMIDELLDTLVLNQPRTAQDLRQELTELCRGAADPDPILHSFKDKELLRIGVRDILGKETVAETTAELSDLAETILIQIAVLQYPPQVKRMGQPTLDETKDEGGRRNDQEKGSRSGSRSRSAASPDLDPSAVPKSVPYSSFHARPSRFVLLGLGKLGGREMSYHSDLDLILIYEGDGRTVPPPGSTRFDRFELTDNFHFFTELAQHIIKMASYLGPMGRLYQVDMRLRPSGKSGSLVIPLEEFMRYFDDGGAQLWERQALTRARIVLGDDEFGREVMQAVERAAYRLDWQPEICAEIRHMRERVQASSSGRDLKRGFGGIADIEFVLQMFRIKYGRTHPAVREPNTWKALDALLECNLVSAEQHATLRSCYDFLRLVESRLRIFHNRSLDELPDQPEEIEKLARRIGSGSAPGLSVGQVFLRDLDQHTSQTRKLFLELFAREGRA